MKLQHHEELGGCSEAHSNPGPQEVWAVVKFLPAPSLFSVLVSVPAATLRYATLALKLGIAEVCSDILWAVSFLEAPADCCLLSLRLGLRLGQSTHLLRV